MGHYELLVKKSLTTLEDCQCPTVDDETGLKRG